MDDMDGMRNREEAEEADGAEEPRELSLDALSAAFAAALGGTPPDPKADGASEAAPPAASSPVSTPGDDACEINPLSILDALLFVGDAGGNPLSAERLAAAMRGVEPAEIHDLVRELNRRYAAVGNPYEVVDEGAGYQLSLRAEHARLREKFYGRVRQVRLSQAAVDVLSLVAYHEPVSREDVNRLRGKGSGALLTQLVRRQLLRVERPESQPRTVFYRTTRRFLELFGLTSLAELPTAADLEQR